MNKVVGIGAVNIDLLYGGAKKLPDIGEEIYTKSFDIQLGGGTPGTIINLGRLNVPVSIVTELGDDIFSSFAKEQLKKNNVSPIIFDDIKEEIPLNISSAIILENDRSFVSYGIGNIRCDEKRDKEFFNIAQDSKIVLMQPNGFINSYKRLKQSGVILVLDTGWDDELSFEKYDEYLKLADYYTPNYKEACKITGETEYEKIVEKLSKYFDKVIVKLGDKGCLGYDGEMFISKPNKKFDAIDTTGAGDAFLAGFVYGLYHDMPFRDCIMLGNLTGGKSTTSVGALSSYYTEDELLNAFENEK